MKTRTLLLFMFAVLCGNAMAQLSHVPAKRDLKNTIQQSSAARKAAKAAANVALKPRNTTPVYDQPPGKLIVASENTIGLFPYQASYILDQESDHMGIEMVESDTALWLKAPFTQYYASDDWYIGPQGWIKLTKTSSGYSLKLPQALVNGTDGHTYYATKMKGSTSTMSYTANSQSLQYILFKVNSSTGKVYESTTTGTEILALTDSAGGWFGYGNYKFEFTPNRETPVQHPDNLKKEKYVWTNDVTKDGSTYDQFISVAFDGDDVWISNPIDTTQYFKGTIEGNKLRIKNDQYMGLSKANSYIYYIRGAKFQWTDDSYTKTFLSNDEDIVMDYDATTRSFSMPDGYAICASIDNADDYFQVMSPHLRIYPFQEAAATPQTPYVWAPESYYNDYAYYESYGSGYGSVEVIVPPHDADGNYLNPEKMYYRMYIDDETKPYMWTLNDYDSLPKDSITEMPLTYSSYDIIAYSQSLRLIFTFSDVANRIGFQSVYYGGGEKHESEIGWYYPTHEKADESAFTDAQIAYGTHKLENYAVAQSLTDPALVGMRVTKLTIPFGDEVKHLINGKIFLTKQLQQKDHQNVADILVKDFDIAAGNVEVTLDEPYTIPEGGIYVGYQFDLDSLVELPLQVINKAVAGNFYCMSSRTWLAWSDRSERYGVSTAMKVNLESDNDVAASPAFQGQITQIGAQPKIDITISNHGTEAISNIAYTFTEGSLTGKKHVDFATAIPAELGATGTTTLTLPAQIEDGNIPLVITIDSVNGKLNKDASKTSSADMKVYSFLPKFRPLMEEYTGTGCGWCPRGLVGLDKMLTIYDADFIAVSYHQFSSDDAMYFGDQFSNSVSGFPAAYFNRNHYTDAYYGDTNNGVFALDKTYDAICKEVGWAPGEVSVEAHYADENNNTVQATATAMFPVPYNDATYAFTMMVIGNELSGKTKAWAQYNYYSGGSWPSDLSFFVNSGSPVLYTYNFVALAWTGNTWIANSIPTKIEANTPYTYTYTFDLSSKKSIIADPDNVQVVVAMIDTTDGHVVNANKIDVTGATGIESLSGENGSNGENGENGDIYSIDGRRLETIQKGLNIHNHTITVNP